MSNGIEIAVQIRAVDTETDKDLPTYFTATDHINERVLERFNCVEIAEHTMKLCVQEVIAEWAEEYRNE